MLRRFELINNSTKLLGGNNIGISVITVCLNSKNLLENTILSVINQTYKYFEYIIIDGGSSDGTIDIIKKYDKYISYWVSENDNGIYDAMNKGIINSTGEIINFLNSGDYFYNNNILSLVSLEFFNHNDAGIVYGLAENFFLQHNLKYISGSKILENTLWKEMPICHQSMFIKKEVYTKIGLLSTEFKIAGDYEFLLRFFAKKDVHKFKAHFINIPLSKYRLYGETAQNYIRTFLEVKKVSSIYYEQNFKKNIYFFVKYVKFKILLILSKLTILRYYRIFKYKIINIIKK